MRICKQGWWTVDTEVGGWRKVKEQRRWFGLHVSQEELEVPQLEGHEVQSLGEPVQVEVEVQGREEPGGETEDQAHEDIFEDPVVLSTLHHSSYCTKCP